MSSESMSGIAKDERHNGVAVSAKEVDTAAQLAAGLSGTLDPEEALRIRKKIDKHILPLMCMLFFVEFMDKTALGNAAVLGIETATNLTVNQYNWLGTIFYLSCLLFEYPQSLALQRLPVGKWTERKYLCLGYRAVVYRCLQEFHGFVHRARNVLYSQRTNIEGGVLVVQVLMNGTGVAVVNVTCDHPLRDLQQHIISGLLAFGSLHIQTSGFEPWQWYMIVTGIITLILAICFGFLFPDSPTTAWFLTPDERVKAIQRIKENQTGIENKHFKMEQFMEAIRDPKTWLFAAFAAFDNVPSSLTNQQSLLVASLGFTFFQTTLLTMILGVIEILTLYSGVRLAARLKNGRAYVGAIYFVLALVGIALVDFLPWSDTAGLLVGQFMTGICTTGFVLALSWLGNVTGRPYKEVKVVTNAIILSAFCIGNIVGPLLWKVQYKPRFVHAFTSAG
ncbi:MFS general substrate transporter [Pisolithus sp. B1]|nr:MFS general substrate transporter [Pisolithus sp. B1]